MNAIKEIHLDTIMNDSAHFQTRKNQAQETRAYEIYPDTNNE
jgi:hypothetical protein